MSGSSWCGCKKASTLLNLTCYKTCFNMLQEQHELQTNTSYSNTSKNPCIIMHHVHFSQLIRIHIAMPSDPPSNKVQVTQVGLLPHSISGCQRSRTHKATANGDHINTSLFSLGSVLHGFERNITQVLSHCMPWPSLVGSSPRRCRMNHTDRADRGLMNNCRSRPHQDGANGV